MNVKMEHIVIIIALLAILAFATGYVSYNNTTHTIQLGTVPGSSTQGNPFPTPTQTQTTPSSTTELPAQLELEITDGIAYTDVATSAYVDVCKADINGVFNFLQPFDSKAQSANPQAMNSMISDGSPIVVHVSSQATPTNGAGYYDGWYYTVLHVGNPIYAMSPNDFQVAGSSPSYTYTISIGNDPIIGYVSYTSGTTPYWNLGKLYIEPRLAGASFTESVTYQGTTLCNVTDGVTWENATVSQHKLNVNATLASRNENIAFNLFASYANLGFGFPMITVQSSGQIVAYDSYLIMTTNMLGITAPTGWSSLGDTTLYAEKGFFLQVGPYFAPKGQKLTVSLTIPIQSQNAQGSTQYVFKFWIVDCQSPTAVQLGTVSTTAPTAYGFLTQYGLTSIVENMAYTTSSGSSASSQLETWLTTST
jgi:hypothetical protein